MSDDRPSIAELQRLAATGYGWPNPAAIALNHATPVLLEIAATGLAWAAAEDALRDARDAAGRIKAAMRATEAFDKHRAALAKVRP